MNSMNIEKTNDTILDSCYQVHKELGIGFSEKVYENSLMIVLFEIGLNVYQQHPIKVYFRKRVVGEFFADILVEDNVILELKAVKELLPEHQAQLINYLSASNFRHGFLINFAKKGLQIKKAYNNRI